MIAPKINKVCPPNLSNLVAIIQRTLINKVCASIQEIIARVDPTQPKKGGHGLSMLKINMYAEITSVMENSNRILLIDTSYDHIDKNIDIGRNRKPLYAYKN